MTIESCMHLVDAMMPNRMPEAVKRRFLGEAEGRVMVELLGRETKDASPFDTATPAATELSAPHPYDQLYWLYVVAMMECVNGNTARYENAATLFNTVFHSYGKFLKRKGA